MFSWVRRDTKTIAADDIDEPDTDTISNETLNKRQPLYEMSELSGRHGINKTYAM